MLQRFKKNGVPLTHTIPGVCKIRLGLTVLLTLVSCFSLSLFCTGCSKGATWKNSVAKNTWSCDEKADAATRRGDYEAGIVLHEQFLEKYPDNGLALYHAGFAYGQIGAYQKEVLYYLKAMGAGFKDTNLFFNLGMAYGELRQLEKSIDAFKAALEIDPKNADNHFGLAVAYQSATDDILAEGELLKAIEIDSRHVEARLYLGMLYAERGDFQSARAQLHKVLEIDPTNDVARQSLKILEKE